MSVAQLATKDKLGHLNSYPTKHILGERQRTLTVIKHPVSPIAGPKNLNLWEYFVNPLEKQRS